MIFLHVKTRYCVLYWRSVELRVARRCLNGRSGGANADAMHMRTSCSRVVWFGVWSFAGADREPAGQIESQLSQSTASPGSCPLHWGRLELGFMSVTKLQVSLVRLVRSTMLESLPACLFMDLCGLTKPDSSSRIQIRTPLSLHFWILGPHKLTLLKVSYNQSS